MLPLKPSLVKQARPSSTKEYHKLLRHCKSLSNLFSPYQPQQVPNNEELTSWSSKINLQCPTLLENQSWKIRVKLTNNKPTNPRVLIPPFQSVVFATKRTRVHFHNARTFFCVYFMRFPFFDLPIENRWIKKTWVFDPKHV